LSSKTATIDVKTVTDKSKNTIKTQIECHTYRNLTYAIPQIKANLLYAALSINQSINHVYFRQSPYEIKKESTVKKYIHKNIYTVKSSCTQQQNYTPIV